MTARGRNQVQQSAFASQPARLPALPSVPAGVDPAVRLFLEAVRERLEVREGARGNPFEAVVTRRDLVEAGLVSIVGGRTGGAPAEGAILILRPDGTYAQLSVDEFAARIFKLPLYQNLLRRLDDPARFNALPEEVRSIVVNSIADEAAKRGADIRAVEHKIQTAERSLAFRVEEVTAAVNSATAGVREMVFAVASEPLAQAGKITQLEASLGNYYQDGEPGRVLLEEIMTATADRAAGLAAEYMVKLNAGRAVAGFGLSAFEDPSGDTESAFIVQADKFALTSTYTFVQEDAPSATGAGQTWYKPSTEVSYRSTAAGTGSWTVFAPVVPFGVDTVTGTVYINGQVRINSGGPLLEDSVSGVNARLMTVSASSQVFSVDSSGAGTPTSIEIQAKLSGDISGTVTWSTTPTVTLTGTGNTRTLSFANMGANDVVVVAAEIVGPDTVTYSDQVTIVKVVDGSPAAIAFLTNDSHTLAASSAGTVSDYSSAVSDMKVFVGDDDDTANWSFSASASAGVTHTLSTSGPTKGRVAVTAMTADVGYVDVTASKAGYSNLSKRFSVSKSRAGTDGRGLVLSATSQVFQYPKAGGVAPSGTITLSAALLGGLSGTVTFSVVTGTATLGGSGASRTLSHTDMTSDVVTVEASITDGGDTYSDRITIAKLREGADGDGSLTALLSNESHTIPANPDGSVSAGSYSGASGVFKVYAGLTDVTTSATFAVAANPQVLTVSGPDSAGAFAITGGMPTGVDVATVTMTATYSGTTVPKVFTLTKAKAGASGRSLQLSASGQVFLYPSAGGVSPSSVTLNASLIGGVTGTPTFSIVSGAATLTGTGLSRTLAAASMTSDAVVVRASVVHEGTTYTDEVTVVKVRDGAEGAAAVTVFLTNETHTVTADASGNVVSYAGATGFFKLYDGSTDVSQAAGVTYTAISPPAAGFTFDNSGASKGRYTMSTGAIAAGTDVVTVTLRATYQGTNYDKVFTVTKAKQGAQGAAGPVGSDGPRGSLRLYSSSVTPPLYSATWSDAIANTIVWQALGNAGSRTAAQTAHLRIGDEVTLTDAASATKSVTRYWSGTGWLAPGVVIDGNLLVRGTASFSAMTTGRADIVSGAGQIWLGDGPYVAKDLMMLRKNAASNGAALRVEDQFGGLAPSFVVAGYSNAASFVVSNGGSTGATVNVAGANGNGIQVEADYSNAAVTARNTAPATDRWARLGTNSYAVDAPSVSGQNKVNAPDGYLPFTGVHDGLVASGMPAEIGDIMVDVECVRRYDVSNTLFKMEPASIASDPRAVGVLSAVHWRAPEGYEDVPGWGVVHVNAVGEGQINVCGLGGNIQPGDYITTSSMAGKGMRQADSFVRPYTVAKAREAATFSHPGEIKMIACVYLSG